MSAWTWLGYWNVVLGATRDAEQVVREFDLDPTDRRGLDVWLATAEQEAWREGALGGPIPESWSTFHTMALDELSVCADVTDGDIAALQDEAACAGDDAMVDTCERALRAGSGMGVTDAEWRRARQACEAVILAARVGVGS